MVTRKNRKIYQFKMTLRDVSPPIWRRIQVWEDFTLHQLHRVIQAIMLWEDYHLYEFRIGRKLYREPHPENERKILDAKRTRISTVIRTVGTEFDYFYDFGDDWHHALLLEAILLPVADAIYPRCIGGERSGPPEDAGGSIGYENYLEAMADPGHKQHEEWMGWRGPFDPEAFSLANVNRRLEKQFHSARNQAVPKPNDAEFTPSPKVDLGPRGILSISASPRNNLIHIKPNGTVPLELNEHECELIRFYTFADEELTSRLSAVPPKGQRCIFYFTLDDLDELAGFIAAEANHAKNQKLQKELGQLLGRIETVLEPYTDDGPIN